MDEHHVLSESKRGKSKTWPCANASWPFVWWWKGIWAKTSLLCSTCVAKALRFMCSYFQRRRARSSCSIGNPARPRAVFDAGTATGTKSTHLIWTPTELGWDISLFHGIRGSFNRISANTTGWPCPEKGFGSSCIAWNCLGLGRPIPWPKAMPNNSRRLKNKWSW